MLSGLSEDKLAEFLGWFSIGLGAAEVASPNALAKFIGVKDHETIFRAYGMREIGAGVGILTRRKPAGWLWARVAGDILDLATLLAALSSRRSKKDRVVGAIAAVAGVTVLDVICAKKLSESTGFGPRKLMQSGPMRLEKTIVINRSPEDCYRFWRDLSNLPRFMPHLESVNVISDNRSHWLAKLPGGKTLQWSAEITADSPNEVIAWRSLPGADIDNSGSVRFSNAPGRRGTLLRASIEFGAGGPMAGFASQLLGSEPAQQLGKDLRRFKQVLETGEVTITEGQPAGRREGATWLDRLARE